VTGEASDKPNFETARMADGFDFATAAERARGQYAIGGAHLVDVLLYGEKLWHGTGLPLARGNVKSRIKPVLESPTIQKLIARSGPLQRCLDRERRTKYHDAPAVIAVTRI